MSAINWKVSTLRCKPRAQTPGHTNNDRCGRSLSFGPISDPTLRDYSSPQVLFAFVFQTKASETTSKPFWPSETRFYSPLSPLTNCSQPACRSARTRAIEPPTRQCSGSRQAVGCPALGSRHAGRANAGKPGSGHAAFNDGSRNAAFDDGTLPEHSPTPPMLASLAISSGFGRRRRKRRCTPAPLARSTDGRSRMDPLTTSGDTTRSRNPHAAPACLGAISRPATSASTPTCPKIAAA